MRIPKVQLLIPGNGDRKSRKRFLIDGAEPMIEVENFSQDGASAPAATCAAPAKPTTFKAASAAPVPAVSSPAAAVRKVNYLAIRDPMERAKAMWADDTHECHDEYDSLENLTADLASSEPTKREKPRRFPMSDGSAECLARPAWDANTDNCQSEFDSFENFRAFIQHRCD